MVMLNQVKAVRGIALELCESNDPIIQGLSSVTDKHLKREQSLFDLFIDYLARDQYLTGFAKQFPDPEDPGSSVPSFVLCTRGPKSKSKYEILNYCMVCFVQSHKRTKAVPE